jgi:UDP-N-acetylmuramyl tripeptide synthase
VSRTLRTSLAIAAGRATGWLSRVSGRGQGATISGRVMNAIAPDLLRELADGQHVAIVSATNGKTTTTRLLTAAVAADGRPVVSNSTGANLTSGIAPTLARADGPGTAVLEVDERVVERVIDPLGARLCVFGNLSRDQLDRYGEVHAVGDAWRRVAEAHPDLAVVANASDPHVAWAAAPAKVTWVDLGLRWRQDAATCPSCGELLAWSEDRFDCASCGFAQPDAAHRLDGDTLVLDGRRIPLELQLPGAWNLANAALALVAATTHFGIDPTVAAQAMRDVESVADGKDPSWLWDVPYEWLAGHPVAAAGERRLDVAVRLRYADLAPIVEEEPLDAARSLDADELYVIASYTQFSALYRRHGTRDRVAA